MMFYVFEASTGDPSIAGTAIYTYPTLDGAVATWHAKMGVAMKSDLYDTELLVVMDSDGAVYRTEKYTKSATEVEGNE